MSHCVLFFEWHLSVWGCCGVYCCEFERCSGVEWGLVRRLTGCGAMVEWYWQGKTEVLGEKHYTAWVVDGWMSVEQWWNDTDRGNWSVGRKTLYSVGGRWMDECRAMVGWYWQGKTEVLGEKHYTAWVVDGWMSMEQWWNDTDRGKLKCWEKNIIQCGW